MNEEDIFEKYLQQINKAKTLDELLDIHCNASLDINVLKIDYEKLDKAVKARIMEVV